MGDESRRCFVGYLKCPDPVDVLEELFRSVKDGTDCKQPEGKLGPIPRKTAWMVAEGCSCYYAYGGMEVEPQVYPPWMVSLMTMEGMVQKHYQHRVPREEYIKGPRINLTWRWVVKHRP